MKCQKCGCFLTSKVTCCPICHTYVNDTNINQNNNLNISQQASTQVPIQQQVTAQATQVPTQQQVTAQATQVPTQQQVTAQTSTTNNIENKSPTSTEEKNKKHIVKIIITLIVVIVAGIFFYPKIKAMLYKPSIASTDEIFETTTFFLPNNDEKFAIFNEDGKQITDFIYTDGSGNFANNTTYVQNEKGESAIITSLGKELVKFGKYEKITDIGIGYIAKTSDGKNVLYNRVGKLVKKLGNNPTIFGIGLGLNGISKNSYLCAGISDGKNYYIINHAGEELLTGQLVENEYTTDEDGDKILPKINLYENKYLSVFYNQHNYIINILTKEKIFEFESPLYFNIAVVNEDKNEIFLKSISQKSTWDIDENEVFEYKLIRNKNVVYTKKHEKEIDKVYYNNGIIEIMDMSDSYILTETGDKIKLTGIGNIGWYTDYNNYMKIGKDYVQELYVNNELKQVFDCNGVKTTSESLNRYAEYNLYVLKECKGYAEDKTKDIIIKPDGTILNDKLYEYVSNFDLYGNLVVSEDGKTSYLIDKKGKKISKNFHGEKSRYSEYESGIEPFFDNKKELYIGKNNDETQTLFDTTGKEYITAKTIENIFPDLSTDDVFSLIEDGDYYIIYNITKQKEILKTKEEPDTESKYIKIYLKDKVELYSYTTGKLFYTIAR